MSNTLRVWWISNPPRNPFTKEVASFDEAKIVIDTLTGYDLYLGSLIDCNVCGLEEFTDGEWTEWYDDDGNDFCKHMEIVEQS